MCLSLYTYIYIYIRYNIGVSKYHVIRLPGLRKPMLNIYIYIYNNDNNDNDNNDNNNYICIYIYIYIYIHNTTKRFKRLCAQSLPTKIIPTKIP